MPTTPSLVRRAAGASARRPRLTLALWLLFVALHRVAGGGTALDREVVAEIVQARAAD